eukprot:g1151.t1
MHTDNGLFILMTAGHFYTSAPASEQTNRQQWVPHEAPELHHGLYVKRADGTIARAILQEQGRGRLIFMAGEAMRQWTHPSVGNAVRTVPHAVVLPKKSDVVEEGGVARLWYGRMFLPPGNAIVGASEGAITFAEYRAENVKAIAALNARQQRRRAAEMSTGVETTNIHSFVGTVSFRGLTSGTCTANELWCWNQCMDSSGLSCNMHETIECSSTTSSVDCSATHDASCAPTCVSMSVDNETSNSTSVFFCTGSGTSMYMDGFNSFFSEDANTKLCVNLWFVNWTLDTEVKFAFASIGACLFGIIVEWLRSVQRALLLKKNGAHWMSILAIRAIQLTCGYFAMLIAMTYQTELFIMLIVGLTCGWGVFNMPSPGSDKDERVSAAEDTMPCCEIGDGKREHNEEGQSSTESKLLIARAMPALIEYLQDTRRTHIVKKVRERVPDELYDAIVYDIEYRMMRRSIRPPKATYVPSVANAKKLAANFDDILTTGRRKRKKAASFAKIQSLKFQADERRRERERIARRKMKREKERVAKIQEKERVKREREERRRLKQMADEKRRLAKLQKRDEQQAFRSAYTRAACEDLDSGDEGGNGGGGDGAEGNEDESSQRKRFGPKVYGRLNGADLAIALSKTRRKGGGGGRGARSSSTSRETTDIASMLLGRSDERVATSGLAAGRKAAQSNPDLISIAHFLWSAAVALRLDTESIRVDCLEAGFGASTSSEANQVDIFDAIMTRLVCRPHALYAFDAPLAVSVGFSHAWWGPRLEQILRGWLERAREVRRACRRRDNELAMLRKWRKSERAVVDKKKRIRKPEGDRKHREKMSEKRRLRREKRRLRKETKKKKREKAKKLSFVKKKKKLKSKLKTTGGKKRKRLGTARARKCLAKYGWTIVERAGAHYVYKAPVGGRRFTSHNAAMAYHNEYVLGGGDEGNDDDDDVDVVPGADGGAVAPVSEESDISSSSSDESSSEEDEEEEGVDMGTTTTGEPLQQPMGDGKSVQTKIGVEPSAGAMVATAPVMKPETKSNVCAGNEDVVNNAAAESSTVVGTKTTITVVAASNAIVCETKEDASLPTPTIAAEDEDEDDLFVPPGSQCAQYSLNAHREWLARRERYDGHVVRVLCNGGLYFDAIVVREMVPDFLYEVWYISDQTTEELVLVGRISPASTGKSSKIPKILEKSLSDNQVLLQRRTWAQKNVKMFQLGKVRRKIRSALNSASDIRFFRFVLRMLSADDLLEERKYWDGLCTSALGIEGKDLDAEDGRGIDDFVSDFLKMDVDRRIAVVSALCYFRIDESDEIRKEVRRVMDYRHRTVSIGLDANQNMLWHFPFLRDGHTRIYASLAGATSGGRNAKGPKTWTLLSRTKADLKRLVEGQRALLATGRGRGGGASSTSTGCDIGADSTEKRSKTLVKFARSTRVVLKSILDNADDAEAAGLARERRACETCVPYLKSGFRNTVAQKFLARVNELEQFDFYVRGGGEDKEEENRKDTTCTLCNFDGFTNPPALTCSKARCGATYHVACMRGVRKEKNDGKKKAEGGAETFASPAPDAATTDYDAKYDAKAVQHASMAWLCPRCRSSRKIERMYRPKPAPKAKKRKFSSSVISPSAMGWRKSSRLRSKPKISYREMEEDTLELSESEEEPVVRPTPPAVAARRPPMRAASRKIVREEEYVDESEEDEEPHDDDRDDWVPDGHEFAPSTTRIRRHSSSNLPARRSEARRSSNRANASSHAQSASLSSRWGEFSKKGQYVGWKIVRMFNGRPVAADVVGYLKPDDEDDPELWHIVHEDGDEEDLEKHEVEEGVTLWHVHKDDMEGGGGNAHGSRKICFRPAGFCKTGASGGRRRGVPPPPTPCWDLGMSSVKSKRVIVMGDWIRSFDSYTKAIEGAHSRTLCGAFVSLISVIIMTFLFIGEFRHTFLTTYALEELISIDLPSRAAAFERLAVDLDVTFEHLSCDVVHVDLAERRGDTKEMHLSDGITFVGHQNGCRIFGTIKVRKVAGKFQLVVGKPSGDGVGGDDLGDHLYYDLKLSEMKDYDCSHRIDRLFFGQEGGDGGASDSSESSAPLDGYQTEGKGTMKQFTYSLKLVPSEYRYLNGTVTRSHRFAPSISMETIDPSSLSSRGGSIPQPGVFFHYDFSPILISYTEKKRSVLAFVTSVCAILGGVFTVSSMFDSFIYRSSQALKKTD